MRSSSRLATLLPNALLVIALAGMWFAFAPTKLGGSTAYVIVDGNSMEPDFHRGDLVIIRNANSYEIGDIVTYWDNSLPAYVIHRIIGIEQDNFLLQGDNNGWIDITRPSTEDILGKLWIHIPNLGKLMAWVRIPLHFALITSFFIGGILMTSSTSKHHSKEVKANSPHYLEMSAYIAVAIFLVFLGFSIYAFSNPTDVPASATLYQQEGHFSYTAASTPDIYDDATITSGEPIFTSQTCIMNVNFSYYLSNSQLQGITGNHQLYARVLHEKSGWQRTIPINQKSIFSGNAFTSAGTLDLCQVERLVASLEEQTGLHASNYKLELIAPVLISGYISGKNITDSFFPTLSFRFDEVHFYLDSSNRSDAAFTFTQVGANNGIVSEQPNYVNLLGLEFNVQTLRILSVTGFLFSIGLFIIIGVYGYYLSQEDPLFLLRLKYSNLIVDVQGTAFEPSPPIIDVDSIETIAKLAERHNTMILHVTYPYLHDYLVQTTQSTYRYSLSLSGQPTDVAHLEEQALYNPVYTHQEPIIAQHENNPYTYGNEYSNHAPY